MLRFPINVILSTFFIVGCARMCGVNHENMTAEQVVEAYLEVALNMTDVSQKQELLTYTTGELNAAIAGATEDSIRKAYIDRKYDLKKFSLIERRDRTPRETEITFSLEYKELESRNGAKPDQAATVTTENTVAVIKDKGLWKIFDVLGNKTSIEFPVTEFSKITASPNANPPPETP